MTVTKTQIGIALGGLVAAVLILAGGGYFLWQENNKSVEMLRIAQEKQAEAQQKAQDNQKITTPADGTSSWKTYRNEQYGFEFKYPQVWGNAETDFVDFDKDEINFTNGQSLTVNFTNNRDIQVGSYSLDFEVPRGGAWWDVLRSGYQERDGKYYDYPSSGSELNAYDPALLIKDSIIFSANNTVGIKTIILDKDYEIGDIPFCNYWFTAVFNTKNKQFPGISFNECLTEDNINFERVLSEFDSIISTFKFIEPIDILNWKTYRNEQYGFEFKYPSAWGQAESEGGQADNWLYKMSVAPDTNNTFGPRFGIQIFVQSANQILDDLRDRYGEAYAEEEISIAGLRSVRLNSGNFSDVIFEKEGKTYLLQGSQEAQFDQILSTFKFIDSPEMSKQTPFTRIREENDMIYYSGTATLSGEYYLYTRGILSNTLCFYVDSANTYIIPREGDDDRAPWFCFDEQESIKNLFLPGTFVEQNKTCEKIGNKATISISKYIVDTRAIETFDLAHLDKVISAELPKCL